MTDEMFVFRQDVKERSQLKSGSYHKKNGSKSKKCMLPSDYLSNKEKKKMSGPVSSINMSKPYTDWISFKKIPTSLQGEYINKLVDSYGARCCDIADMFSIKVTTLSNYCSRFKPHPNFRLGQRVVDNRWLDFITAPSEPELIIRKTDDEILSERFGIPMPIEEKEQVDEVQVDTPKESSSFIFNGMESMRFSANGTKAQIIQMLDTLLGDNFSYSIAIDISNICQFGICDPGV